MSAKPLYLSLNKTAPARLANLRTLAEKSGSDWRKARAWGFSNWEDAYANFGAGFNGTNERNRVPIWYSHTGEKFRNERFADECSDAPRYVKNNLGYYSDCDANETVRGVVANLPHGQFIVGYYWSSNDERVYFGEVYTEESEAARAADCHAARYAEVCREDDYQYQAARRLEDETDDALHRLRECVALRHCKCMAYVRDEITGLLEAIRKNREKLRTTYAAYV